MAVYGMKGIFEEWRQFQEEILREDRGILKFPELKKVNTRPEQDIQNVTSDRQKKILARKILQAFKNYKKEYGEYPGGMKPPSLEEMGAYIDKVAEQGGGLFMRKNPELGRVLKKIGADFSQFGDKDRGQYIKGHEAMHSLFNQIGEQYGSGAYKVIIEEMVSIIREQSGRGWGLLYEFLTDKYVPERLTFREEMINWVYNILSFEDHRNKFKRFAAKKIDGHPGSIISNLKKTWKKLQKFARNIDEEKLIKLMKKHD